MVVDDDFDIISSHENVSLNGEWIADGAERQILTLMELDLAYSSEKLQNLEMLMMQVSDLASDYEILFEGPEELLMESIEKAFQFDILSGYLNSEMKDIESFMSCLLPDVMDVQKKFTKSDHHLNGSLLKIDENLVHAKESLRNSQDQLADLRKQSNKFEKFLAFGLSNCEKLDNGECSPMNSKWKLHTVEQQRHFLLSLEKSLAREMDFEKKLSESRYNEEELKIKIQIAEQNTYYIEEFMEVMMVKMFTAENYVEVLLEKFKEFMKLQNCLLRESNNQHNNSYPESANMENIIEGLKENILEMQSRAESAEAQYVQLMKANVELNDEVGFLKSNGAEKANCLERKLKESDMQLEHANASVEAIEEQQKMLYTSLNDMEHLIEDLKGKVSKAENRAESSEAKCTLLTDTNLELNEELSFLRDRLESLEVSLHQTDMEKVATVKGIRNCSRLIIELAQKLAFERERLQLQISVLTKRNKILIDKCLRSENNLSANHEKFNYSAVHGNINSYGETLAETLPTNFQVDGPISSTAHEMKLDPAVSAEDAVPNIELVRTIDATQLNWKYILMAFIFLLLLILAAFFIPT